ncbi:MAG: YggT family protein [Maritimibacter sp.]
MLSLLQILFVLTNIIWYIVLAYVIMSWLVNFQVVNLRQPLVAQIWSTLNRLVEPMFRPIRRFMPNLGALDISPLVVIFILMAIRIVLTNSINSLY